MSDCFGRRLDDRVEWSIPIPNEADQVYKLLGWIEYEAERYDIDTHWGDWFHAEVRPYEHHGALEQMRQEHIAEGLVEADEYQVPTQQLTFWLEIPAGKRETTDDANQ